MARRRHELLEGRNPMISEGGGYVAHMQRQIVLLRQLFGKRLGYRQILELIDDIDERSTNSACVAASVLHSTSTFWIAYSSASRSNSASTSLESDQFTTRNWAIRAERTRS